MKTSIFKTVTMILSGIITMNALSLNAQQDTKPVVAVIGIDSKGMDYDAESMAYMVRLEMEKTNVYYVMDRYDVSEILSRNSIDPATCMGKTCVVEAGKVLKADKMVTGSIERFGEKIVISLKVIDVKSDMVEKQDVTEYLNLQVEIQKMIGISVQKLLGLTPDKDLVSLLVNYDAPIKSPKTKATYSGPRMGGTVMFGQAARRFNAPTSEGGFNMFPVMFNFGWQQEIQYLSSGNFSALVEIIPMIGGLESGKFIPSLTLMNGFRMGKGSWEFAFGPSFRLVQMAQGYYAPDENGDPVWHLEKEWNSYDPVTHTYVQNPYPIIRNLDSRGKYRVSASLMLSVGRTFKSGYLNIPVNVYASFRREGTVAGVSCGFNITRHSKKERERKRHQFLPGQ